MFAIAATVTAALGLLLVACGDEDGDSGGGRSGRGGGGQWGGPRGEVAAVPVKTATATRGAISSYIQTHARLEAERWVNVVARTQGMVEELRVEEGDRVAAGDLLVRLDRTELNLRVQQAEVTLEQARATHARRKALFDRQMVSEEDYELARNQLQNAEVALKEDRLSLAYADIEAPISGVVMMRHIEVGDLVGPNQEVFVVADLEPLLARIRVPEKRMGQVRVGQRAAVNIDAIRDHAFEASVRMINPGVDPQSGTVKVTLEVPARSGRLKPGMFATVRLITEMHPRALVIPKKALVLETDEDDVFVVDGDRATRTAVEIGFVDGDRVEVLSGLDDGSVVITVGQEGLKDGAAVRAAGTGLPDAEKVMAAAADEGARGGRFGAGGAAGGRGRGGGGGRGRWGGGEGGMPDSASMVSRMMEMRGLSEGDAIKRWNQMRVRFSQRAAADSTTTEGSATTDSSATPDGSAESR